MIALKLGVDLRTGAHHAGRDGGDENVVSRELRTNCIGETGEREFAGGVGGHVRHGNSSPDGRNIHDTPASFSAHLRRDEQIQNERCPEMQAHGAIEIFELQVLDRTDFNYAGIVYQDVDLAKALKRFLDSGLDLRGLEQVALNRQDFSSEAIQVFFRARELFGIPRDESDFSSARANLARDFQAEPARAARNESEFVFEKTGT